MTIDEFNFLNFNDRASILKEYGNFIDEHLIPETSKVKVFEVFGFFVEVSYRLDKKVQYIRAIDDELSSVVCLDPIKLLHLN